MHNNIDMAEGDMADEMNSGRFSVTSIIRLVEEDKFDEFFFDGSDDEASEYER